MPADHLEGTGQPCGAALVGAVEGHGNVSIAAIVENIVDVFHGNVALVPILHNGALRSAARTFADDHKGVLVALVDFAGFVVGERGALAEAKLLGRVFQQLRPPVFRLLEFARRSLESFDDHGALFLEARLILFDQHVGRVRRLGARFRFLGNAGFFQGVGKGQPNPLEKDGATRLVAFDDFCVCHFILGPCERLLSRDRRNHP